MTTNWPAALDLLRSAGARINRIGPETTLREALQVIADTAVELIGDESGDEVAAVIYTYDAARGAFDPGSRVSAGERAPLAGDVPRTGGVGATAIRTGQRVLSYESGLPFHPLKHRAGIRTAACYPLLVSEVPVGALYVDLRAERRFTDDELLLLDTFVPLSAAAIHNTRQFDAVHRQLQRKVVELERLQRAAQLISSRPSLSETLDEILYSALQLTGAEHGSFRLLERASGLLQLRASNPAQPGEGARDLSVNERTSVMAWVARHRQPALIHDLRQPPWAEVYVPLHPEREMRSELAVPMLGPGGGLEGVLNVESPRPRAFDYEHQNMLAALATQAAIALQEARLLSALEEITGKLLSVSPDELLNLLIQRACDLLDVPHCVVWELEADEPRALRLRAANFAPPWPDYAVPVDSSFIGETMRKRRANYCADMRTDPRVKRRKLAEAMSWVSALAVPLMGKEAQPRGVFAVYTTAPRAFTDWETRLLTSLANHAAVTFQQSEALTQLKLAQERQAVAETFAVLGDVAANLLHRVNNMVGVIPQLTQSLADLRPELCEEPATAKKLADIETSARNAMTAARDTFSFLRPLRLGPVSVAACYKRAVERVEPHPHVQVKSSGLGKLPPAWAGEEQLQWVLFNLLENAVDALDEQPGQVTVSGRRVTDALDSARRWVEVSIADTGPGIPPEARERIFDATFSTKESGRKMGFGLWWVKSWVQRFGGSIRLAETSGGCTFIIRLPIADEGDE